MVPICKSLTRASSAAGHMSERLRGRLQQASPLIDLDELGVLLCKAAIWYWRAHLPWSLTCPILAGSFQACEICMQAGNLLDRIRQSFTRESDGLLTDNDVQQPPLNE